MPFSREAPDARRSTFLSLSSQIEGQLRDLYDIRYNNGEATQSSIAEKLGVNRSVVHRRLSGYTNMTAETIADMVWALNGVISITICASEVACANLATIKPQAISPVPSTPPSQVNVRDYQVIKPARDLHSIDLRAA
ncbi:MAG: hypothetical protein ABR878_01620 [Roseiarcus sp.]|jgi:hypothetical protein